MERDYEELLHKVLTRGLFYCDAVEDGKVGIHVLRGFLEGVAEAIDTFPDEGGE
jgi:hypothetical protein